MEEQEAQVEVDDLDRRLSVRGIRVVVAIPFTGLWQLWHLRPSSYTTVPPVARDPRGKSVLELVMEAPLQRNGSRLRSLLDGNIKELDRYIANQARDIESHNASINMRIRKAIEERRKQLDALADIVSTLNIPLRRRAGEPNFLEMPLERKLVLPLPPPANGGVHPEPGIAEEHYETILSMIRHTGRTFEASPDTFAIHGEEEFRDWILAGLNALYEGGATAETFRKMGKTDIRIEDSDRSAFVAECKIWSGSARLAEALDQLCGYLTWRDCKACLVIFNKFNARFSELLDKIPKALKGHKRFVSDLGQPQRGEWRCVFRSTRDGARRVIVHAFIFDIYSETSAEHADAAACAADP